MRPNRQRLVNTQTIRGEREEAIGWEIIDFHDLAGKQGERVDQGRGRRREEGGGGEDMACFAYPNQIRRSTFFHYQNSSRAFPLYLLMDSLSDLYNILKNTLILHCEMRSSANFNTALMVTLSNADEIVN